MEAKDVFFQYYLISYWVLLFPMHYAFICIISVIYNLIKNKSLRNFPFKKNAVIALVLCVITIVKDPSVFKHTFGITNSQGNDEKKFSPEDEKELKEIFQTCFSGEPITSELHERYYALVDKYGLENDNLLQVIDIYGENDLMKLHQLFWEDALKTIQTKKIVSSKKRIYMEEKLLTLEQRQRNQNYIQKILNEESVEISGELVVITEDICIELLEVYEENFKMGLENIKLLENRNTFE